ncbi:MAG: class I SAM-dependent methyltransferase [Chloroflexi bacterium]|nr:class I SAM-dependent methyltransferase [Chloroflexota bacterium]
MPAPNRALHEQNRLSWNAATKAHNSHKGDQAKFFREGGNKLYPEERALLGDLHGQRLVHLQCNSGQDSVSLAQLGAEVTGVDISDEAIAFARRLSADSGIPATFVRADVYDWLAAAGASGERWDVAFCSYGAFCWLSDIDAWARGVAGILAPGGRFAAIEFHPALSILETDWSLKYDYFRTDEPYRWDDGVSDYVAASGTGLALTTYEEGVVGFQNPHPVYEFNWPTSRVISALIGAGLVLEHFREYPYSNGWTPGEDMRVAGKRAYPPARLPSLPLMYSVAARKP